MDGSVDGEREGSGGSSALLNSNTTSNEFDPLSLLSNKDIETFQVLLSMTVEWQFMLLNLKSF